MPNTEKCPCNRKPLHCTKMDQDDLEDELIWKTVVAHFDMASEKISYRVANQVTD